MCVIMAQRIPGAVFCWMPDRTGEQRNFLNVLSRIRELHFQVPAVRMPLIAQTADNGHHEITFFSIRISYALASILYKTRSVSAEV